MVFNVPAHLFIAVMGVLGLLFGSFANVVVWRVPRGESVMHPGSHCPACETAIRWHDNIPVLSWLLLRARCRSCGARIPVRYPAVEVASALLFASAAWRYGAGLAAVFAAVLLWGLLVLALIDLAHFRLPDPIVGGLGIAGVLGAVTAQLTGLRIVPLMGVASGGLMGQPVLAALAGALAVGGAVLVTAEVYALARKRQGLGMGDVKLLTVLGLFLGLYGYMALALASLTGTAYVVATAMRHSEQVGGARLPFGVFLAIGGVITVLFGPALWAWYLALVGLA